MSILAKNLKTIRRELKCTQSVMADILKVGFRTYVRYEAGERDAPVSMLVKMAKLGNTSLEQLLTMEIKPYDLMPLETGTPNKAIPEVQRCNFQTGQIKFKKPSVQGLLTLDNSEKKLLAIFRKMDDSTQRKCLENVGKVAKENKMKPKTLSTQPRKKASVRRYEEKTGAAGKNSGAKSSKVKKKGRPGRKKLDKKLLKEKIDRLKMVTKSISKITVK